MSRHTAEQRRSILGQWHHSGLTAPDFAIACGVSVATLYKWRREAAPAFVEIVDPPSVRGGDAGAGPAPGWEVIELSLPCGAAIRVAPGFDAATLRRVVEALA